MMLAIIFMPSPAHAALNIIDGLLSSAITFPAQVIGYIFGFITKTLFTLGGWLIKLALNMNDQLLSPSSPVLYGWNIVLNFANLGFVLAIIVIAFATILRMESYAMKQTLWKLIVAALLVNFSLVIAGAFINASNILTNYFLDASTMNGQGIDSFSETFAGIFQAQGFLKMTDIKEGFSQDNLQGAISAANALGTGVLTTITSIFFLAFFTFISALTLLAIAIMLIIRYVYVGILLILVPIVWLLWIFPATQKHWQKWWSNFIRWTFFPPIMLFFLYLDVYTMKNLNGSYVGQILAKSGAVEANTAAGLTFGLDVVGNLVIMLGLALGGLIAANALSITFASTAYGWAQGAGKMFGGWVGRKGIAAGTFLPRTERGRKIVEGIQKFGAGRGVFGRLMSAPIRKLGTAVSGVGIGQGEKLVKSAEERINKRFITDKSLADSWDSLGRDEKIAATKRFTKNKTMNLLSENQLNRFIGDKGTQGVFERHGAKIDYENFKKAAGRNYETVNAAPENKEDAYKEFYQTHQTKDFENLRKKAVTADKKEDIDKDSVLRIKTIIETQPGALAKLMPKLSGKEFNNFMNGLVDTLPETIREKIRTDIEKGETKSLEAYFEKNNPKFASSFKKNLGNRVAGWEYIPPTPI